MCGIAGFIDFNNSSSEQILRECTDTMVHRGPDGSGYEFIQEESYQIGLGHRRLSIIDLTEGGRQPMQHNNLLITFNGEIYNYAEIKSELLKLGHAFQSNSDTETILHAYQEWGIDSISRFRGMFAYVIYDKSKQEIYCVRDRAGAKPFYYYWKDGLFLFGSELKSVTAHPRFKKDLNLDSVASYMQYGYVPTPHCIWKNTFKLRPGHFLKFSLSDRKQATSRYWNVYDAYNKPKLTIDFEEAKLETERILKESCEYRMVSDVPVGVFLSGGYDSSTVTALLQTDRTEKIKTFTIGMPDLGLNEAPYAKDIAEYLGTDHTEYNCSEVDALNIIKDLPFYYDEPFADSSAIPTMLVSKIAREKVTVALSADAGDEVFAGYFRYEYLLNYRRKFQSIPRTLRTGIATAMEVLPINTLPILKKKYVFNNRYNKIKGLLKNSSPYQFTLNLSQQFNQEEVDTLLKHRVKYLLTDFENKELQEPYFDDLSYMMAIDYQTYLPDDILQKVDRATMSVALEGREPLLDHHIIEWAAQLPNEYKFFEDRKKYILTEINKKYIPASMMDRPKMGFSIPIAKWLANDLKELVQEFCNKELISKQGIFNPTFIDSLLKDFFAGEQALAAKIWYVLMFQMWYQQWN